MSSRYPSLPAEIAATCSSIGHGWYCGWLSVATIFWPRVSACCVARSSSEPNCANASSSRYCARSSRRRPATFFIAFVWADVPTRDTEMPTFTAGRTPEKKSSDWRKICVGDGDHIRRDIRRHVTGLRLDHRERGQRAAAQLLVELAGAFEEPRVEVEDV